MRGMRQLIAPERAPAAATRRVEQKHQSRA
jgi:hypothetical protein